MGKNTRSIQYFFFGQDFADGLRITLVVLVPALLASYFGQLETGLTVALGALCVSITDLPGPVLHKRNGMLYGLLCMVVVALITGFARLHNAVMGVEVMAFSFLFTLFTVYGTRAGAVGSAALLVMILTMDLPLTPAQVLLHAALVAAGGLWYILTSVLFFRVQPYRPAQRALGECIHAVAAFLRIKAEFYQVSTDLAADYRRVVAQQIVVNEKQDAARQLLFKSREIVKDSTSKSRALVLAFVDVVDLYEYITATYYDYTAIRERFGPTGILEEVAALIKLLAEELDAIGLAIHAGRPYTSTLDVNGELERLKRRIDAVAENDKDQPTLVLKKILVNIRSLQQQVQRVMHYFSGPGGKPRRTLENLELGRFVSSEDYRLEVLTDNLTRRSNVFRHALRMAVACTLGFVVAKLMPLGHHSYWIVMTVAFMLKPGFSLTKQRNYERVAGTLAGGAVGVLILRFVPNATVQFGFMLCCMLASYSAQRRYYFVSVFFMTPFILILFSFLGIGYLNLLEERVIDTLLGCTIAFSAGYLLFPTWEATQLRVHMREVVKANLRYLQQLAAGLAGQRPALTDYKVARKDVYVSSANLSAAFQRMLSEPESKRRQSEAVQQFVVLNHILSANIAALMGAPGADAPGPLRLPPEGVRPVNQALAALAESLQKLDEAAAPLPDKVPALPAQPAAPGPTPDDQLLLEQLAFLQKVSTDIRKVTDQVLA
ncbi:FUSC family protein [Hymenobacter sp. BT175]|uniref:FUSC family membrane protein n=1 Tax=Hymenobacter translucens TaxID=2886507 RepID=UPI001D0DFEF2|nr:FUSC family membrane protein [Hymenobacter translucens]MCC2547143.1 FUSC family protein [Hymenobacter translucens]